MKTKKRKKPPGPMMRGTDPAVVAKALDPEEARTLLYDNETFKDSNETTQRLRRLGLTQSGPAWDEPTNLGLKVMKELRKKYPSPPYRPDED